jgi:hypothetical protein
MAPKEWATPPQKEFLTSYMALYLEAAVKKKYERFWPPLFEQWFIRFPEPEPQCQIGDDSPLEKLRGLMIEKRKKVCALVPAL